MKKIIVLMLSLMILVLGSSVFAETLDVNMSGEIGLDGKIKRDSYVPISVTIENKGEDIKGILRVLIPQESYGPEGQYISVSKDVEIPKGTKKLIKFGAYITKQSLHSSSNLIVELNADGLKKEAVLEYSYMIAEGRDYVVGVLSSDRSVLSTVNSIYLDKNSDRVDALAIDLTDILPENMNELDMIDYVLIKDFNKDILNAKQLQVYESLEKNKKVFHVNQSSHVASFETSIESELSNQMQMNNNSSNQEISWRLRSLLGSISKERLPKLWVIVTIAVSFVFIVGPVNFIVLKIYDKTHYTWYTMSAISFVFVMGIFILGKTTTLSDRMVNEFDYVVVKDDIVETTGVFALNGSNSVNSLEVSTTGYLYPITERNYNSNNEQSGIMYEISNGPISTLKFNNSNVFSFNYAKVKEMGIVKDNTNALLVNNDRMVGTLERHIDKELKDVMLLTSTMSHYVGDFDETSLEVDVNFKSAFSQYRHYEIYDAYNTSDRTEENKYSFYNQVLSDELEAWNKASDEVLLIGWSDGSVIEHVDVNGKKSDRISQTLYMEYIKINYKSENNVLEEGVLPPRLIDRQGADNHQDVNELSFYRDGNIVLEFDAIVDGDIEEMMIYFDDISDGNNMRFSILNLEGRYEAIELISGDREMIYLDEEMLKVYLTQNRSIIIKVESGENSSIGLPTYSVKGVNN